MFRVWNVDIIGGGANRIIVLSVFSVAKIVFSTQSKEGHYCNAAAIGVYGVYSVLSTKSSMLLQVKWPQLRALGQRDQSRVLIFRTRIGEAVNGAMLVCYNLSPSSCVYYVPAHCYCWYCLVGGHHLSPCSFVSTVTRLVSRVTMCHYTTHGPSQSVSTYSCSVSAHWRVTVRQGFCNGWSGNIRWFLSGAF